MLTYRIPVSAIAVAVASSVAVCQAQAQSSDNANGQPGQNQAQQKFPPISEWNYDEVYEKGKFLGTGLLGTDAIGENGDDIGDIANAVLDEQNRIIAVIAEVGGFWDIADTHVIVPWDQVELSEDGVRIPVNEDNIDDYDLYGEGSAVTQETFQQKGAVEEGAETGERSWKLTELLNDYSNLQSGAGYGYVDNAVFSEQGELLAILVMSSGATTGRGGATAYPFHGFSYGWYPGMTSYELPYSEEEVSEMTAFDYQQFDGLWEDF